MNGLSWWTLCLFEYYYHRHLTLAYPTKSNAVRRRSQYYGSISYLITGIQLPMPHQEDKWSRKRSILTIAVATLHP
ncbi:hypothetical protein VTN49DRAFT_5553 [Thermomyces lanuginosus]|uniref:uncharacterized protein n=1 Tax=Thermomyces lanuginosus TaxID=5541 RepID=UPI0037444F62